ncbi:MAG: LysR substrate-binding domain-containing protein [Rhodospirillales bacterium]
MSLSHLPSVNAIRAFEAAARLGSFKAAAAELCVTPSAISHQVSSLESTLRVSLFERRGRHLALSEAGKLYGRRVSEALKLLMQASDGIADLAGTGVLTVVSAPSLAAKWLMPRLDGFLRRHPDLRVRVETSADRSRLGDADVGIFYGTPPDKGHVLHHVIQERMTVLCSPQLLQSGIPLAEPGDLARHVLIHARNRLPWQDWLAMFAFNDLVVRRELSVERSTLAIDAAIRGVGVILESDFLTADELRDGRLIEPFQGRFRTPLETAYTIVTRGPITADQPVAAFMDWLGQEIGSPV